MNDEKNDQSRCVESGNRESLTNATTSETVSDIRIEYAPPLRAWYVARSTSYLGGDVEYLHADGVWRGCTLHKGRYLGYYHSRERAEAAIAKQVGSVSVPGSEASGGTAAP